MYERPDCVSNKQHFDYFVASLGLDYVIFVKWGVYRAEHYYLEMPDAAKSSADRKLMFWRNSAELVAFWPLFLATDREWMLLHFTACLSEIHQLFVLASSVLTYYYNLVPWYFMTDNWHLLQIAIKHWIMFLVIFIDHQHVMWFYGQGLAIQASLETPWSCRQMINRVPI